MGSHRREGSAACDERPLRLADSSRDHCSIVRWPWPRTATAPWLCDLERGLFTWDGQTLAAVPAEQHGNRAAFSILADRAGRIWTGHLDGTISVHEAGHSRLYTSADGVSAAS